MIRPGYWLAPAETCGLPDVIEAPTMNTTSTTVCHIGATGVTRLVSVANCGAGFSFSLLVIAPSREKNLALECTKPADRWKAPWTLCLLPSYISHFACAVTCRLGKVSATPSGERDCRVPYVGLGLPFEERGAEA